MKKILYFSLGLFFSISGLYSQSVSPDLLEKIKSSGELQNVFLNDDKINLSLVPKTELSSQALTHWNNSDKPRLTTEKLFYLDKKDLKSDGTFSEDSSSFSIDKVSKVIRSISTMKGTEYYSNRHKKWETLYHDAYLVKSPDERVIIPDDTQGSADGKTLYCMQDDNSFGKCWYELTYSQRENEVSVCFDNFEPLKFGFITAAKAHNVKINLVVVDEGDHFLVYLMVQANYPRIAMLEEKMLDSFNARVDSIYKWFVKEMGAAR
ncbi:DUF6675 family protein [uncultured Treponema sp.]|uniref:DUF6675 family protein n=1 Tax=uncultured Treponema sp. TaxID=162155 RepID=UPI0025EBE177|nr:DUF6675 family protein [uncultured Treponema sp.]